MLPLTQFSTSGMVSQERLTITFDQAKKLESLGITRYSFPLMIMFVVRSPQYMEDFYRNTDRRFDQEQPKKGQQLDLTKPTETREEYRLRMAEEFGHLTPSLAYTRGHGVGAHCPSSPGGLTQSETAFYNPRNGSRHLVDYITYPAYTLPELLAFFSVESLGAITLDQLHPVTLCDRLIACIELNKIDLADFKNHVH